MSSFLCYIVGCYPVIDMLYTYKCIVCGNEIFNEHILEFPKVPLKVILEKKKFLFYADKELPDRPTSRDLKIYCFDNLKQFLRTLLILTM